jgi:metal-responsive CopG/Arc/MetJ family transcriptional regulator
MPAQKRFTTRVEVQFDPVELDVVDWAANKYHLTRSEFIRDAVAAYVDGVQNEENRRLYVTYRRALRVATSEDEETS